MQTHKLCYHLVSIYNLLTIRNTGIDALSKTTPEFSPYLKFTYALNAPEFLLNEKLSTLDNYFKYLDTGCELAKVDKVQVIEIVRNKNNYKRFESINKILD